MKLKLGKVWETLHSSYWFVPTLMVAAAVGLSFGTLALDRSIPAETLKRSGWIFTGGPDGARDVLSTIAGSMITVAGVTFSIIIVALSLASSQFGPRLLYNFMRNTGNQVVLGTFVATFVYCLLVLRTIRGAEDTGTFVPHVAVTVGTLLGLASLGVLIYFIHHASMFIQAPNLVFNVAQDLHDNIDKLFPERFGHRAPEERLRRIEGEIPDGFERDSRPIHAEENGYLQGIGDEELMEVATGADLLVRLEQRPGKFVVRGTVLARVWPGERVDDALAERIHDAFVFGHRRTVLQDVEFSLNQLTEVAVRALSPGINDPFTAMQCADHLGAALCHAARRDFPSVYRLGGGGRLRVIATDVVTFRGMTESAFDQIRQNASHHVSVRMRLLEVIATVTEHAPDEDALDALLRQAEMIRRGSAEEVPEEEDREQIEERFRAVLRARERRRRAFTPPEAIQPV